MKRTCSVNSKVTITFLLYKNLVDDKSLIMFFQSIDELIIVCS
ncbi:hypothetical protein [Flavobacterium sp. UBA6046]|nr:hypothetical protein [Flavobacterium sp. UBA6046]